MFIALWIHLWPNDWITTNWICTAMTITKVRLCYFNPQHIKCKEWPSSPAPHPTMLLVVQIKWENWVYSMNGWKKQKDCIGATNDKKKIILVNMGTQISRRLSKWRSLLSTSKQNEVPAEVYNHNQLIERLHTFENGESNHGHVSVIDYITTCKTFVWFHARPGKRIKNPQLWEETIYHSHQECSNLWHKQLCGKRERARSRPRNSHSGSTVFILKVEMRSNHQ